MKKTPDMDFWLLGMYTKTHTHTQTQQGQGQERLPHTHNVEGKEHTVKRPEGIAPHPSKTVGL